MTDAEVLPPRLFWFGEAVWKWAVRDGKGGEVLYQRAEWALQAWPHALMDDETAELVRREREGS
jgi:hypothetical protein